MRRQKKTIDHAMNMAIKDTKADPEGVDMTYLVMRVTDDESNFGRR